MTSALQPTNVNKGQRSIEQSALPVTPPSIKEVFVLQKLKSINEGKVIKIIIAKYNVMYACTCDQVQIMQSIQIQASTRKHRSFYILDKQSAIILSFPLMCLIFKLYSCNSKLQRRRRWFLFFILFKNTSGL